MLAGTARWGDVERGRWGGGDFRRYYAKRLSGLEDIGMQFWIGGGYVWSWCAEYMY